MVIGVIAVLVDPIGKKECGETIFPDPLEIGITPQGTNLHTPSRKIPFVIMLIELELAT